MGDKQTSLVPWAIRDDLIVHVDQVERGLACGCYCPACGAPLLARQGDVRIHHFAHAAVQECPGYLETMIHVLAKNLLVRAPHFWVPPLRACYNSSITEYTRLWPSSFPLVFPGRHVPLLNLHIEKDLGGLRPDAVFTYEADRLAIEIAVTNKVSSKKLEKIVDRKLPTLEIRVPRALPLQPLTFLEQIVLDNPLDHRLPDGLRAKKTWPYYPNMALDDGKRSEW